MNSSRWQMEAFKLFEAMSGLAAPERMHLLSATLRDLVEQEREECAAICDRIAEEWNETSSKVAANEIRGRGLTP